MELSVEDAEYVVRGLAAWKTDLEVVCEFSGRPDLMTWKNAETLVRLALHRTRDMVRVEEGRGDSSSQSDLVCLRALSAKARCRQHKDEVLKELRLIGSKQKRRLAGLIEWAGMLK